MLLGILSRAHLFQTVYFQYLFNTLSSENSPILMHFKGTRGCALGVTCIVLLQTLSGFLFCVLYSSTQRVKVKNKS